MDENKILSNFQILITRPVRIKDCNLLFQVSTMARCELRLDRRLEKNYVLINYKSIARRLIKK